jgi:hypothetical protein
MKKYKSFGLFIESDFEIPELLENDFRNYDIKISENIYRSESHDTGRDFMRFYSADHVLCNWGLIGVFEIIDRKQISVMLRPDCDRGLARFPLLGAVMALVLQLNDKLVLHASATVHAGRAGVFIGDKGAGKSTTAAAMITGGHKLLSDDVVALSPAEGPLVFPAYPNVKLNPSTAATIGLSGRVRTKIVAPGLDKDQYIPAAPFQCNEVVARDVFVLRRGERLNVESQSELEAFQHAMRYSYLRRFGTEALKDGLGQKILAQCTQLARHARFHVLYLPDDLTQLPLAKERVDGILEAP